MPCSGAHGIGFDTWATQAPWAKQVHMAQSNASMHMHAFLYTLGSTILNSLNHPSSFFITISSPFDPFLAYFLFLTPGSRPFSASNYIYQIHCLTRSWKYIWAMSHCCSSIFGFLLVIMNVACMSACNFRPTSIARPDKLHFHTSNDMNISHGQTSSTFIRVTIWTCIRGTTASQIIAHLFVFAPR